MAELRGRAHVTARFPLDEVHLADTSAWSKARNDEHLADIFDDAVRSGLIATCDPIALELLRSARDGDRFVRQQKFLSELVSCPVGISELARARRVQAELAARGQHRGVKPMDLLIAAAAEAAALPILHYDDAYDLIAAVTAQPVACLAERGSLP